MKKKVLVLSSLIIASMMFTVGCSKDEGPADSGIFVGTYRGSISFNNGEENISDADGRLLVVRVGNTYNFEFGTGIPNITNVKFEKSDSGSYVSVGKGVTGITISAGS